MRFFFGLVLLGVLTFSASAQDGMYGSFIVGQKFVNLDALNSKLQALGYTGVEFPNNNWTYGGEGHMVISKYFIVGGKAFGILHERKFQDSTRLRMTGGLGLGTLGVSLVPPNSFGIRLYPQVGVGLSTFILQRKENIPADASFDTVMALNGMGDNMVSIGKTGWAVDAALGLDWYKPFKNFFAIIKGLDLGPMIHAEVGYTFVLGTLNWLRDVSLSGTDNLTKEPELKFGGFYFNVGIGLGLSPAD